MYIITLGEYYTESPPFDLEGGYSDSNSVSGLIETTHLQNLIRVKSIDNRKNRGNEIERDLKEIGVS